MAYKELAMNESFSVLMGIGAILFWWIVLAVASRRKLGVGDLDNGFASLRFT